MKRPITIDFLEKGTVINTASNCQLFRQISPYLLTDPCIYLHKPLTRKQDPTWNLFFFFFEWSTTGFNLELTFLTDCCTKVKEFNLSYYLPLAKEKRDGLIAFPEFFFIFNILFIVYLYHVHIPVSMETC